MNTLKTFTKQPAENKPYVFDYRDWLPDGDSISSYVITADAGISLGSVTQLGTQIIQFISGGTDGIDYKVTCRMTTAQGIIDEREISLRIREL